MKVYLVRHGADDNSKRGGWSNHPGDLLDKSQEPLGSDHKVEWISIIDIKGKLFASMQEWAVEIVINSAI